MIQGHAIVPAHPPRPGGRLATRGTPTSDYRGERRRRRRVLRQCAHGCAEICTHLPAGQRPDESGGVSSARPITWPGWPRVISKPSRYLGVIVTAAVAVALALYYRGPGESGARSGDARGLSEVEGKRGGQIVGSIRSEPRSFNRLLASDQASDLVSLLTQGPLIRTNRVSFALEPWLAERWESSADGLTHTAHLRPGLLWSDGTPLTSADVLFSLQAALDPKVMSVIAGNLTAGGEPIRATASDAATVVFTYAGPAGEGIGLLDVLPILPKHKLESALASGTLASAWGPGTPPADIVGAGPFVLRAHVAGQRLVFDCNPHYRRMTAD